MKIQDILFIFLFIILIIKGKSNLSAIFGIISISLSIPLFAKWIFFTAERLTWYGAGFILLSAIQVLFQLKDKNENRN
jgi:hypothetical protein